MKPPDNWKPSAEDLRKMRDAPVLDLDAHLGGSFEEASGLAWLKEQEANWDGVYVHFCTYCEQSAQDVKAVCGKRLSTWAAPGRKLTGNKYGTQASPERDLGYSFTSDRVTCPSCIEWMKNNYFIGKK